MMKIQRLYMLLAILLAGVALTASAPRAEAQFGKLKEKLNKAAKPAATPEAAAAPRATSTPEEDVDATASKTPASSSTPLAAPAIAWQKGADMSPNSDDDLTTGVISFALAPDGTLYAGSKRVYASADGGKTWTTSTAGMLDDPFRDVLALAVSPKGTVFASVREAGVWMSVDKGKTWKQSNPGEARKVPAFRDVVSLAVNAQGHVFAGTDNDGLFVSLDNGKTWKQSNQGLPKVLGKRNIHAIAFNAQGHVYLGMEDRSVQVSTDNGATWAYAGGGIDDWTKANTGTTDNTALSLAFAADGSLVAGTYSGLFRTADGGKTWKHVGALRESVHRLALGKGGEMYALRKGNDARLWVSNDNGATWAEANVPKVPGLFALAFTREGRLLAGAQETEGLHVYAAGK